MAANVGSYTLTGTSFTFSSNMGVRAASLKWISGNVYINATMPLAGLNVTNVPVTDGTPITISDDTALDGVTINATGGSVYIIARQ